MVFSDQSFLFVFCPVALLIGVLLRRSRYFCPAAFVLSLVAFFWSSGVYTLVLLFSVALNYVGGLLISATARRWVLFAFAAVNLLVLAFFKYAYFLMLAAQVDETSAPALFAAQIVLPIGISFYTFQGISYLVDVYRRQVEPERNILVYGAYQSFFPQVIAGPIVRYKDVEHDFHHGAVSTDLFAAGASRFLLGLSKKVIIADTVAIIADAAFALPSGEVNFTSAWLGAIAYGVQIYYDFSGYSDMAIGLGLMLGIRFLENFNHPYAASTFTAFWRRWHISLSSWFRDYLYIPLGGNRRGASRTYLNLLIVFLLTGLWHGAQWTFVCWGLWHGAFLVFERIVFAGRAADVSSPYLRLFYFFPAVLFGWVLFRAPDFATFADFSGRMLQPFAEGAWSLPPSLLIAASPFSVTILTVSLVMVAMQGRVPPAGPFLASAALSWRGRLARLGFAVAAAATCAVFVLPQEFSPFLYFRF